MGIALGSDNVKIKLGNQDVKVYLGDTLIYPKDDYIPVTDIIYTGPKSIKVGETVQLTADIVPENATNKKIYWQVMMGGSYMEVTQDGLATGVKISSGALIMLSMATVGKTKSVSGFSVIK